MRKKRADKPDAQPHKLTDWMDKLVLGLRVKVKKALALFDVDAIHDARVATRRLRAGVDVVEPMIGDDEDLQRLRRSLRRIRRRLGPLRDLDVMFGHLDERWARGKLGDASEWARGRLARKREDRRREDARKRSVARLLSELGAWWGVMECVAEVEHDVESALPGRIAGQLGAFVERAEALAHPESAEGAAPDPHALRIAGKLLRYTLEIADATGQHVPPPILKLFKRVQESLGLWHDYAVLAQEVMRLSLEAELAYHDRVLCGKVMQLARGCWARAEQQLRGFVELWKRHGQSIKTGVETLAAASVPEAAPVEGNPPADVSATPDTITIIHRD